MDIKVKINKAIIKAKRQKLEFNTVLLGREEKEELKRLTDSLTPEEIESFENPGEAVDYNVKVIYVDEDSFYKAVYIPE